MDNYGIILLINDLGAVIIFSHVWSASLIVILIIFLIPITAAHLVEYLDQRYIRHLPKGVVIGGMIAITVTVEVLLTMLVAAKMKWAFTEAHFTVGFLAFIFIWFMQVNEYMGNQSASVDNKVFGSGKEIYSVEVFRFRVHPISVASLLYFITSIGTSIFYYV